MSLLELDRPGLNIPQKSLTGGKQASRLVNLYVWVIQKCDSLFAKIFGPLTDSVREHFVKKLLDKVEFDGYKNHSKKIQDAVKRIIDERGQEEETDHVAGLFSDKERPICDLT